MPEFDLDAALTWTNPLADARIYLRRPRCRYNDAFDNPYEVYATYKRFYHFIGTLEHIRQPAGAVDCLSPFEVHAVTLCFNEGIEHLIDAAGKFLDEKPDRFWEGRKSHLVNAKYHARI